MRITNTEYTPLEVLAELLATNRFTNKDTKEFFVGEHSSHEWLTAEWADKLEVVLNSFRRFGTEVCEQQHIRDYGVDVRMTFEHKIGPQKIGFQIKSNREAEADAKKPKGAESMVAVLKRQAFEAAQRSGVSEWWVVLCFDRATHAKRVQAIYAELLSGSQLPLTIKVIDPRKAMSFLSLDEGEIDAISTLLLCRDDEVLKQASMEIIAMTEAMRQIVLPSIGPALNGEREIKLREIKYLVNIDDCEDHNLAIPVNELEGYGFLRCDGEREIFTVEPSVYPGLCALYFEGRVRHNLSETAAADFMQRLAIAAAGR